MSEKLKFQRIGSIIFLAFKGINVTLLDIF